jgi:hypothetical protein
VKLTLLFASNSTTYNILPVTLDWLAGSTTSVVSSTNGTVQTYNFTGDGAGDEPGLVVIYILSASTYVWSFLIFFEDDPYDSACYGYWGWPKELGDCVNWLQSSAAQKYPTNQGPYVLGPRSAARTTR